MISSAKLNFKYSTNVKIELLWEKIDWLNCVINDLKKGKSKKTPNGTLEFEWIFDLHEPNGSIALWAKGFELHLLEEPKLSETQSYNR
jgi:hypothetical protein